jgi:chromosome segregation ATPase
MPSSASTNPTDPNEMLKQLQDRFQEFHNRKIQIETQRDETNKTLDKLRQQAEAEFGSSDIKMLKEKLAAMTQDNQKKVADYDQQLKEIETKLNAVTQTIDSDESN